jgi:hypothetical protein
MFMFVERKKEVCRFYSFFLSVTNGAVTASKGRGLFMTGLAADGATGAVGSGYGYTHARGFRCVPVARAHASETF